MCKGVDSIVVTGSNDIQYTVMYNPNMNGGEFEIFEDDMISYTECVATFEVMEYINRVPNIKTQCEPEEFNGQQ